MPAKIRFPFFISSISKNPSALIRLFKKRVRLALPVITVILVLTACGSSNSNENSASSGTNTMAPASELALGTLKLEDTDLSVDSELSAQLLPLWQLLNELNSSSSAAPQEITAVVETIQSTMTPEQVKAITAMHLTQADIATASQSGGSMSATSSTSMTRSTSSQSAATGGLAVVAAGVPPDAGGMPLDGGLPSGLSSSGSTSSNTASKSQSSSSNTAASSLIKQVIELLQRKIED